MAAEKKESRLKKIIPLLFSPAAIGIYLALILSYASLMFYQTKDTVRSPGGILKFVIDADQKSLDYRLKFRGVRPASEQVGVLAVDDRSIEIVGRWPWPRDTIAIAINNAFEAGAKVISSDMVWSEPSARPEVKLVEDLAQRNLLPPQIKETIVQEVSKSDPDEIFASHIEKNKDKFIIGNFFDNPKKWLDQNRDAGFQSHCHDIVFKNSPLSSIIERQQFLPVAQDAFESRMPEIFSEAYALKMQEIEDDYKANNPAPSTGFDAHRMKLAITEEKLKFCDQAFLARLNANKPGDLVDDIAQKFQSNWPQFQEAIPELKASSYDEWFKTFSTHNLVNMIPETLDWTLTIPTLSNRGAHFGYFNAELDNDGTIRLSQLLTRTGSTYMPSIALQAYLLATNQTVQFTLEPFLDSFKGISKMTVNNDEGEAVFDIPVTRDGRMTINYAGPGRTIPHATIADLLNDNDPLITINRRTLLPNGEWAEDMSKPIRMNKKEFFKDKILVLGATAIGVFDLRVTPFDENFPGVETHANVIDNLLRRDFLARSKYEDLYMPAFMLVLGIFIAFALSHFGALSGMIFAVSLAAAMVFFDKYFLFTRGHLVSVMLPLFQVIFTYVFLTFYKYFTEERSKKELRATFSKYVSPAIVEEILQDPKNLELGGRKERVTVFFSDVRGFTTISEKLDPRALSDLLNSYLTPMTDLVFKNQGTLDKYMGDAIMAFFGAPVHYPDHAKMACRCALQNLEKLKELQALYEKKKLPNIDIGIGLNTGECSVGNMGSETVRSYTVMGDAVNLASRLEGINKTYGTHIIISEFTYEEVKNDFICREVDWVRVKGKLEPVKIYELIAEGKAAPHILEMVKNFGEGYEHYHRKQFDKAITLFNRAVQAHSEDETSKIYIERCQEFIQEPPPSDWDGVYVMKTK